MGRALESVEDGQDANSGRQSLQPNGLLIASTSKASLISSLQKPWEAGGRSFYGRGNKLRESEPHRVGGQSFLSKAW